MTTFLYSLMLSTDMEKHGLQNFSPEKDLRLYSFPAPFKDEETGTQGAHTDIPFKNAFNYNLFLHNISTF